MNETNEGMDVGKLVMLMARKAMLHGADADDSNGVVVSMLHAMGLDDPFAWFAVCRAIGDLQPRKRERIGFIR